MSYSREHYRRVSPPRDTPEAHADRIAHANALRLAQEDVARRFPGGITPENAAAYVAYQDARQRARIASAVPLGSPRR